MLINLFVTRHWLLLLGFYVITSTIANAEIKQATDNSSLKSGLVNPGYHEKPSWFKDSFLDLREDVQEASDRKKRVLLYFYQDGCPYCAKLLQDNLGQKRIARKTQKNFDVIAINMWGDKEVTDLSGRVTTEKKFSQQMKVMYTPTLVFLTEKEKVALRVNGYYAPNKFETALDYVRLRQEHTISFREYTKTFIKQKSSGQLHKNALILKPPYHLKKLLTSNKPLLLLFEQKKCRDCDELHTDIFKRKETIEQMKRFNIVRLNMWSKEKIIDFSGKTVSVKKLAKNLNIAHAPSFIFFDEKGVDVFRIDAYLKSFHIQSVMDYIASKAYITQSNFQRFISQRADELEKQGKHVDLMD